MSVQQVWGHDINSVFTTEAVPRGTMRHQLYSQVEKGVGQADASAAEGERWWTFIFNDEAATAFAQGDVVIRDTDYNVGDGIRSTGVVETTKVLGIAGFAIAAGSYGWVVRNGVCKVKSDGVNDAAGTSMTSAASGRAAASAATTAGAKAIIGVSRAASGTVADALYSLLLQLPLVSG